MTNQLFLLAQLESFAEPAIIFGAIVILVILLIILAAFGRYLGLYIQSSMTGAGVHFIDLIMMSFRKVNPTIIVRSKIMAVQSQLTQSFAISTRALEAHYLAGGNVPNVIRSLIAANKAKIDLDWQTAQAIDLAGSAKDSN